MTLLSYLKTLGIDQLFSIYTTLKKYPGGGYAGSQDYLVRLIVQTMTPHEAKVLREEFDLPPEPNWLQKLLHIFFHSS